MLTLTVIVRGIRRSRVDCNKEKCGGGGEKLVWERLLIHTRRAVDHKITATLHVMHGFVSHEDMDREPRSSDGHNVRWRNRYRLWQRNGMACGLWTCITCVGKKREFTGYYGRALPGHMYTLTARAVDTTRFTNLGPPFANYVFVQARLYTLNYWKEKVFLAH